VIPDPDSRDGPPVAFRFAKQASTQKGMRIQRIGRMERIAPRTGRALAPVAMISGNGF